MPKVTSHLFLWLLISSYCHVLTAQGLEHEISFGPQITKVVINEYEVGILGGPVPQSDRLLMGYTFNWTVRTKPVMFQPGLQLKSDMSRFNVYLPVNFPGDFMEDKQSRWDNIYTAYRLGIGGSLRINLSAFYIQPGISYLYEISDKTTHQFYVASSDDIEKVEGDEYSQGSGAAGELQLGLKFGKGPNKKFGIAVGAQYLFVEQSYTDEVFLHYWAVQPTDFFFLINYRLTGDE